LAWFRRVSVLSFSPYDAVCLLKITRGCSIIAFG
jgi:hypothetical protein